jgi:hypothetical protein
MVTLLFSLPLSVAAPAADFPGMTKDDLAAAFTTAGFTQAADGRWIRCQEDPPTLSYMAGQAEVIDLNGDGSPEVWISEGSTFCYGNTGNAVVLLTRAGNSWRKLLDEVGMQMVLETKHDGWPDIEIGGPGFEPFSVYQWDGIDYIMRK